MTPARFISWLACLMMACGTCRAAVPHEKLNFDHLSVDQGLSQVTGNCVIQDRFGFMWFGTQNGLNRHNGYDFRIYLHDPEDAASLADSYIWTLFIDSRDRLWVGTYNGGLNQYHYETDTFRRILHSPSDDRSLSNNTVRAIAETADGAIWVGTDNGLNRMDPATGECRRYLYREQDPASLSDNIVLALCVDAQNRLWVGTRNGGLNQYRPATDDFRRLRIEPGPSREPGAESITALRADRDGRLWVGTIRSGLHRLDPATGHWEHFHHDPGDPASLPDESIHVILQGRNGTVWIGTESRGLSRYHGPDGTFGHYRFSPGDPTSLCDNYIRSLYEDRSGTLWVGTYHRGFSKYNRFKRKFVHYKHDPSEPGSLSNNTVRSIFEDSRGTLWIGTAGGGLNRLRGDSGTFETFRHDSRDPFSLSDDTVRTIAEDAAGRLWVGTDRGLNRFDAARQRFISFRHDPQQPASLSDDHIRDIFCDSAGTLWIGTNTGGLNRFNPAEESFTHYRHDPADPDSLCQDCAYVIFEDSRGRLWIGTEGGLARFHAETEVFINFRHQTREQSSLSQDIITSLLEDRKGRLWIGTWGGGLDLFHPESHTFSHFTEKDGLPSNAISGILEDGQGRLWISTINGLARFDPDKSDVRRYDVSDGLQSNGFNGGAYFKSASGEMFFGGINGFNVFRPADVRDNPYIPPVILTQFRKFEQAVQPGKPVWLLDRIELSHQDNYIAFEFAALDFADPAKNQYAYKLEGFDQDWIRCGTRRFASYTNLDGGEYVLHIRAANNDGVWNETGLQLQLYIRPPFYETAWFYTLSGLALLLAVMTIIRTRTRHLQRLRKKLKAMVDERTWQLQVEKERAESARQLLEQINLELEKLSLVASRTDNAVIIADAEGKIEWINDGFTRMTGETLADLTRSRGATIREASVNPHIEKYLTESVTEKRSVIYESVIVNRQGREICVSSTLTPIFDEQGELRKFVVIDTDITARKQAEDELREAKKLAEAASEAKSLFLANMSHEIRTPMNGIIGMTELALDTELDPEQQEYLEMVKSSAESLLGIINDILDFSKIEAGKMELEETDFSLRTCLNKALKTLAFKINEKGLELLTHIDADVPDALIGDPGRLRQIILNLVGNAIKFTDQGEVVLRVKNEWQSEKEVGLAFSVTDTGPGIPAYKQASVFNAFEQGDTSATRKFGGTGLGLAICAQLIRLMGGQIRVESPTREPRTSRGGPGSTFHFLLRFRWQTRMAATASWPEPAELQDISVLVVDDNPLSLRFLEELLQKWDMRVTVVDNAPEALSRLEKAVDEDAPPFRLAILDSQMPDMDGFALAEKIRSLAPLSTMSLIMLTSAGQLGDARRCRELGVDSYLMKPIRSEEIMSAILSVLGVAGPDSGASEIAPAVTTHETPAGLRILVVEDNLVNRQLLVRLLEKRGHWADVAENGRQAVEMVAQNSYHAILMDLQMPEMDGFAATVAIREREETTGVHMPIIALTAHALDGDRERCLAAGMDGYLAKPINSRELYGILEEIAAGHPAKE